MKKVRVLSQRHLKDNYFLLWLPGEALTEPPGPGQFVMLRAWEGQDPLLARPFSLHDVEEERFAVLYQVRGRGTELLSRLRRGDEISVLGPLGIGFPKPRKKRVFLWPGASEWPLSSLPRKNFLPQVIR